MGTNILIIEDKFTLMESTFDYVNSKYYDGRIIFTVVDKITEKTDWQSFMSFDGIIIDIELGVSSLRDGFGVIEVLNKLSYSRDKIVIMTGHDSVKEKLVERRLPDIFTIYKPVGVEDIKNVISRFISK